jgi:hypothetical protein
LARSHKPHITVETRYFIYQIVNTLVPAVEGGYGEDDVGRVGHPEFLAGCLANPWFMRSETLSVYTVRDEK